jgi:limonene 1,2-monooxygenase
MYKDRPLRFGVFLNPFHKVGLNPHLTLQRDLDLARHLDALGYDELWYGEHHSSGAETIASPELMIAAASQITRRIRLGTGVASLPYHNPYTMADRIVQLDHITRGRMMFGAGPGQLLQDATMLGIDPATQRPRMEEALEIMLRLFAGETVTHNSDWFRLQDAELQHRPFSNFEVAVTAIISPSGPKLAGRLGAGLLTLGSTTPFGVDLLAEHWKVAQTEAAAYGKTVERSSWRLLSQVFVAESMDEAIKEVDYGLRAWLEHHSRLQPGAVAPVPGVSTRQMVEDLNAAGKAVIGTPDMVVTHLRNLAEKSGGYGCFLLNGAEVARWPAMLRHYELMAEEVFPHFTGQLMPVQRALDRVIASGNEAAQATARSQQASRQVYEKELQDRAKLGPLSARGPG